MMQSNYIAWTVEKYAKGFVRWILVWPILMALLPIHFVDVGLRRLFQWLQEPWWLKRRNIL